MLTVHTETSTYLVDYPKRFMKLSPDNPNTVAPSFKWVECLEMTYPEVGSSLKMAFMFNDKPKIRETTTVKEVIDFAAELGEV